MPYFIHEVREIWIRRMYVKADGTKEATKKYLNDECKQLHNLEYRETLPVIIEGVVDFRLATDDEVEEIESESGEKEES